MGKGDQRSRKGKVTIGSSGKTRSKRIQNVKAKAALKEQSHYTNANAEKATA